MLEGSDDPEHLEESSVGDGEESVDTPVGDGDDSVDMDAPVDEEPPAGYIPHNFAELREAVEESARSRKETKRRFKWGCCPLHKGWSLQPHLLRSGKQVGHVVLYCSGWWRKNRSGGRLCWRQQPLPRDRFAELPSHIKQEYSTLRSAFTRSGSSR